jgi:hypothetical protein
MYFNYLDEFTGERSTVYSSSFNSEGNWYMDVSNAVGEDGKNFLDRFDTTVTNILVELTIDAGPLGVWKKTVNFRETSPVEMIVIRDPLMIEDVENGVVEIESGLINRMVQGVEASSCLFAGFCGPCGKFEDGVFVKCSCPSSTLKSRKCNGESSKSLEDQVNENAKNTGSCGNGTPNNGYAWYDYGDTCKRCVDGRFIDESDKSKCPKLGGEEVPPEVLEDCGNGECEVGETFANCAKDCYENPTCKNSQEGKACFISGYWGNGAEGTCDNDGRCTVGGGESKVCDNGKCEPGETFANCAKDCYESLTCRGKTPEEECWIGGSAGVAGSCNNIGRCTVEKEIDNPVSYSQTACWENTGGDLYYITNGEVARCRNNQQLKFGATNNSSQRCQDLYNIISSSRPATAVQCNHKGDYCVIEPGVDEYYCDGKLWNHWNFENEDKNPQVEVPAGLVPNISNGEPCNVPVGGYCYCNNLRVYSGESCPEVSPSNCSSSNIGSSCAIYEGECRPIEGRNAEEVDNIIDAENYYYDGGSGVICVKSNNTCYDGIRRNELTVLGVYVACRTSDGMIINQEYKIDETNTPRGIVNQVLAEESSQYIIDPATSLVKGLQIGSYAFEYQGEIYMFDVSKYNVSGSNSGVFVYIDKNSNQKFDEDEDIMISEIASVVNIISMSQSYKYSLTEGLNFVSFPFLISGEEYRTAAGLLTKLNEVYNDSIYSISKFDGRWKMVGQNVEVYDNEDFQLLPGEGYMIKAKQDIDISIVGQPVQLESTDDNSPIYLSQGWNLIGLYGTGIKTYTAKTLIQDINTNNFTSDNVTKWAKDKQMYEGFQMTDGEEYGFDYPLNQLESYFVRITEGKGNWQPSLGGNN